MLLPFAIAAVVGYLLGSLPFGYLVARAKGVNIFQVGSGNPGATNVRRVLGHGPGNLVLVFDLVKGAVAAGWPLAFCYFNRPEGQRCGNDLYDAYLLGVAGLSAAMVGHSFSCFTKFKGGKGVATGGGGFLVLFPAGAVAAAVVFGLTLALTRYVSLSSMMAGVTLPVAAWLLDQPWWMTGLTTLVAGFVIMRHRTNITRLLAGTENKVGQNKPEATP